MKFKLKLPVAYLLRERETIKKDIRQTNKFYRREIKNLTRDLENINREIKEARKNEKGTMSSPLVLAIKEKC